MNERFPHLSAPGSINGMPVRNRIVTGPMERAMANPDGSLTARYIDYLVERARGGASLIQIESTFVDLGGRGNPFQVGCHDDLVVPALSRATDLVHEHGAKLAMELHHGGRQASPGASGRQPIAPSAIPSSFMGPGAVPREMTQADIDDVIDAYRHAARRCVEAGVDLIHLHGAHGYLLGQFLSPQSNHRTDAYGGSLENRARFPLEVFRAVREIVGPDYPVGYRISAVEFVEGGLELDDTTEFCRMLAEEGIDFIDVAGGTYESMALIFQGPRDPVGGFVDFAVAIKAAVGEVPVSVAQRLADPELAESVLRDTDIDFVTLTRSFHADAAYAQKVVEGRPEDILPCIGCNACLWMTVNRVPAGCAVNPQATFESSRSLSRDPAARRVLVVGAGVAGLQSARMLADRGHDVTIADVATEVGGQLTTARRIQPDQAGLVEWFSRELERSGVSPQLGVEVDVEFVRRHDPDAVIIATGAMASSPRFDTDGVLPVIAMTDALDEPVVTRGGRVVIVGGDAPACHLAIHLAGLGAGVTVVDTRGAVASERPAPDNILVADAVAAAGIQVITDATVERTVSRTVHGQARGTQFELQADVVILGDRVSRTSLAESLRFAGLRATVTAVGDAVRPRDIYWATFDAAEAAQSVGRQLVVRHVG